jgi:hypothetical protein
MSSTDGGNDAESFLNEERKASTGSPIKTMSVVESADAVVSGDSKSNVIPKRKRKIDDPKPSHILMNVPVNHFLDKESEADRSNDSESNNHSSTLSPHPFGGHGMDSHIQNDYIAKRMQDYENCFDWDVTIKKQSPTISIRHPWDGVSKVERDLVECCEGPMESFVKGKTKYTKNEYGELDVEDSDEYIRQRVASSSSWSLGGVLAVEKEVRFAAILATQCRNMVSKSLAIAILERTLEVYLRENAAKEYKATQVEKAKKGDERLGSNDNMKIGQTADQELTEPPEGSNTPDSQFTRTQHRRKRNKHEEEDLIDYDTAVTGTDADTTHSHETRRFEYFFSAGGLKILNQWIEEASGYDVVSITQPSDTTSSNNSTTSTPETVIKRRAPATRPIVYTILRFLEHIPFDKEVVMSSKINKQVQKLGKRINAIIEAEKNGEAPEEDLANWTTDETVTRLHAIAQCKESVNAVKTSWREQTSQKESSSTEPFKDPFQYLKDQIKERLEELTQFEAGMQPAPEWYHEATSTVSTQKSTSQVKKKLTKVQEMAASERNAEREELQQKIEKVRKKNQFSLALMREKLRKQREEYELSGPATRKYDHGKQVRWKDGLNTQTMRYRRKLEEVSVYIKGTPSAGWDELGDGQIAVASDEQKGTDIPDEMPPSEPK